MLLPCGVLPRRVLSWLRLDLKVVGSGSSKTAIFFANVQEPADGNTLHPVFAADAAESRPRVQFGGGRQPWAALWLPQERDDGEGEMGPLLIHSRSEGAPTKIERIAEVVAMDALGDGQGLLLRAVQEMRQVATKVVEWGEPLDSFDCAALTEVIWSADSERLMLGCGRHALIMRRDNTERVKLIAKGDSTAEDVLGNEVASALRLNPDISDGVIADSMTAFFQDAESLVVRLRSGRVVSRSLVASAQDWRREAGSTRLQACIVPDQRERLLLEESEVAFQKWCACRERRDLNTTPYCVDKGLVSAAKDEPPVAAPATIAPSPW